MKQRAQLATAISVVLTARILLAIIFLARLTQTSLQAAQWSSNNVPSKQWSRAASSADGYTLALSSVYGPIYTSTDSGVSWRSNSLPNYAWQRIAVSADGKKIAAAGLIADTLVVYTSADSGTNWTQTSTLPGANTYALAASANLSKLVAAGWNTPIYVSNDAGSNWVPTGVVDRYATAASSADGSILIVPAWNTPGINVSTNGGTTWSFHEVQYQGLTCSACSADGTKILVTGISGGLMYYSRDSGATWGTVTNAPAKGWGCVTSSADGTRLTAYDSLDNGFYTSTDAGLTWTSNSAPHDIVSMASSADGNRFLAACQYSGTFILNSTSPPTLRINAAADKLQLSWTVPSTHFIVQQKVGWNDVNWVSLTNVQSLELTNLQNQISLDPSTGIGFYRLAPANP